MNIYVLNIQMYMHMYIVCKNAAMYNQTMYTTQYGTWNAALNLEPGPATL